MEGTNEVKLLGNHFFNKSPTSLAILLLSLVLAILLKLFLNYRLTLPAVKDQELSFIIHIRPSRLTLLRLLSLNLTYNKWIVEKNHFMRQVQSAASTSPIIVSHIAWKNNLVWAGVRPSTRGYS